MYRRTVDRNGLVGLTLKWQAWKVTESAFAEIRAGVVASAAEPQRAVMSLEATRSPRFGSIQHLGQQPFVRWRPRLSVARTGSGRSPFRVSKRQTCWAAMRVMQVTISPPSFHARPLSLTHRHEMTRSVQAADSALVQSPDHHDCSPSSKTCFEVTSGMPNVQFHTYAVSLSGPN